VLMGVNSKKNKVFPVWDKFKMDEKLYVLNMSELAVWHGIGYCFFEQVWNSYQKNILLGESTSVYMIGFVFRGL
jgi:hypothetical protein